MREEGSEKWMLETEEEEEEMKMKAEEKGYRPCTMPSAVTILRVDATTRMISAAVAESVSSRSKFFVNRWHAAMMTVETSAELMPVNGQDVAPLVIADATLSENPRIASSSTDRGTPALPLLWDISNDKAEYDMTAETLSSHTCRNLS